MAELGLLEPWEEREIRAWEALEVAATTDTEVPPRRGSKDLSDDA